MPDATGLRAARPLSTQEAFGRILVDLSRQEAVAPYLVTAAPDVATSTNLAGFINRTRRVQPGCAAGLERGPGAEVGRGPRRPAHRARHQRDEPVPAARPARPGLGPVRPAAAAGRHGLRPVRAARPGRVHLLGVLGRAVHRGRHPVRGHPGPRGRRAPVDDHPVGRARAARASRSSSPPTASRWTGCCAGRCSRSRGPGRPAPGPASSSRARPAAAASRRDRVVLLPAHHPRNRPGSRSRPLASASATRCCAARFSPAPTGWSTRPRKRRTALPRCTWSAAARCCPRCWPAAAELADEGIAANVVDVTSADRLYRAWQRTLRQGVRTATAPSIPGALRSAFPATGRRS